jgi:hypothetical protein
MLRCVELTSTPRRRRFDRFSFDRLDDRFSFSPFFFFKKKRAGRTESKVKVTFESDSSPVRPMTTASISRLRVALDERSSKIERIERDRHELRRQLREERLASERLRERLSAARAVVSSTALTGSASDGTADLNDVVADLSRQVRLLRESEACLREECNELRRQGRLHERQSESNPAPLVTPTADGLAAAQAGSLQETEENPATTLAEQLAAARAETSRLHDELTTAVQLAEAAEFELTESRRYKSEALRERDLARNALLSERQARTDSTAKLQAKCDALQLERDQVLSLCKDLREQNQLQQDQIASLVHQLEDEKRIVRAVMPSLEATGD